MRSRWRWESREALHQAAGRVPRKLAEASGSQVQRKGLQSRGWQGGRAGQDSPQRDEVVKQGGVWPCWSRQGGVGAASSGVETGRSSDPRSYHAKNRPVARKLWRGLGRGAVRPNLRAGKVWRRGWRQGAGSGRGGAGLDAGAWAGGGGEKGRKDTESSISLSAVRLINFKFVIVFLQGLSLVDLCSEIL